MKSNSKISLTCIMLLLAIKTFAQLDPVSLAGAGAELGKSIFGGINNKKKAKNIQSSISKIEINGSMIPILRVEEEKIISSAKKYIVKIQAQLEQYLKQYNNHQHIKIPNNSDDIAFLKSLDKDWPTEYYDTEIKEYKIYQEQLMRAELFKKDSMETVHKIQRKKIDDSLEITKKHFHDSLVYVERISGYQFINKEFTYLKEKPSEKSPTIGKIYKGSYIKVLGSNDNSQYFKISIQDIEGFINKNDVCESLEKINATNSEIVTYKSRHYYKYEPNFEYTPQEETSYSSSSANSNSFKNNKVSSSGKKHSNKQNITYIRGPRGGCYYITSSGTKVYVDRGLCR